MVAPIHPIPDPLKPCPFCNSRAMLVGGGTAGSGGILSSIPYGVECSSKLCEAKTQRSTHKDTAIANWNMRTK